MAKAPAPRPMFAGFETAAANDGAATDWWTMGNDICNALLDARTMADIERIKTDYADRLREMTKTRRDLARTVSLAFQLRRQELGQQ